MPELWYSGERGGMHDIEREEVEPEMTSSQSVMGPIARLAGLPLSAAWPLPSNKSRLPVVGVRRELAVGDAVGIQ
jgi:hypothetical protein